MQLNREPGLWNGVNCQVHETFRHRRKVGLDFATRGVTLMTSKFLSALQNLTALFPGNEEWTVGQALSKAKAIDSMEAGLGGFLEHSPFAYLSLFMVVSGCGPRPRRSGSWTLLVCTECMRLLQTSLPPSIHLRLRYMTDRRHSSPIT